MSALDYLGGAALNLVGSTINNAQSMGMSKDIYELNSPKNQVKRLREAGLSPWIMNGQSTNASTPSANPTDLAGAGANSVTARANAKLTEAQAHKTEQETDQQAMMFNYLLDQARWNARNAQHTSGISEAEHAKKQVEVLYYPQFWEETMHKLSADATYSDYVTQMKKVENDMFPQFQRIGLNNAQEMLNKLVQEVRKTKNEADQSEVASKIAKEYGILPNDDGFKALLHVLLTGKGDVVIKQLATALGESAKQAGGMVVDGAKKVWNKGIDYLFGD